MIRILENVNQPTIRPLIKATIAPGTLVHTDEYDIYRGLKEWGYRHKTVCHGKGEYARDEDGDYDPASRCYSGGRPLTRNRIREDIKIHDYCLKVGLSSDSHPHYIPSLRISSSPSPKGAAPITRRKITNLCTVLRVEPPSPRLGAQDAIAPGEAEACGRAASTMADEAGRSKSTSTPFPSR